MVGSDANIRRFALPAMLVWLWWPVVAFSAERLQVQLTPVSLLGRSHAPRPVEVLFRWAGTAVLEGRLDLQMKSANQILGHYRSPELALTSGEQRFVLLLPPCLPTYDRQVDVLMSFVTAKSRYDLGTTILNIPSEHEQSLVMGVCDSTDISSPQVMRIEQSLRSGRFRVLATDSNPHPVSISMARLTPEEMAAQPLTYCAYDLMVVTANAFVELHERQLEALLRWVRAGGSLCVFAGNNLNMSQQKFLTELGADATVDGITKSRTGVGRCVLVKKTLNAETDLNSATWLGVVDFLWKVRIKPQEAMPVNPVYDGRRRRGYGYAVEGRTSGGRFPYGDLRSGLLPQRMRLIPLRVLAGMLALFVIMIGPADYFVLGLLKRRRYTWVLFPVVTAAFTVATVQMANRYLGRGDHHRALVFVDVGKAGVVLRQNRYELLFAGRDKEARMDVQGALWASMDRPILRRDLDAYNPANGYFYRSRGGLRESGPTLYEGTIPTRFQVRQIIHQWEPQLNRVLSLERPPTSITANWDAIDGGILESPDVRQVIGDKLFGRRPISGDVFILHGTNIVCVTGSSQRLPLSLISAACTGGTNGLFSVVAQIAPTGGGNFEDLAVLDESDPVAWMIVIVTEAGEDILVYRRLYHVEG